MHRAGSVSVQRLGLSVRSIASAPKPNVGNWGLPEPPSDATSSTSLPLHSSSAYNSYKSKWARPTASPEQSQPQPGSSSLQGITSNYKSKRARASVWSEPQKPRSDSSGFQGGTFQRQAAPHVGSQQRNVDGKASRWDTRFDVITTRRNQEGRRAAGKQRQTAMPQAEAKAVNRSEEQETEQDDSVLEEPISTSIEDPVDLLDDTSGDQYTRNPKLTRQLFKERGSIASRLSQPGSVPVLPSHSRVKTDQAHKPKERAKRTQPKLKQVNVNIFIPSVVSVGNLAKLLNVRLDRLQRKMVEVGMEEQSSYDHLLNSEYASLLAMEFNRNPIVNDEAAFDLYPPTPSADHASLPSRPPVVTIMGHVDHGKTTLLDTLRSTAVAKGEAGGITQHIGAFSVPVPASPDDPQTKKTITFLDTPGHAAFSAMRARGARVTDIVVLVVAADDGIMPQTREVLDLVSKDAKVGLVVAINKVDKPGADVKKVEAALFAEKVQIESYGGDVPCVHVSGLTGEGLPQLVETISILSEMQDVRAETNGPVHGYVLESKVSKGLGAVATVLVLRGELKPGSHLIAGTAHGKVRLLFSPSGSGVKSVLPGTAAVVSGWKELPKAGDEVLSGSEGDVKRALANRLRKAADEALLEDAETLNETRRVERERKDAEENAEEGAEQVPETRRQDQKKELLVVLKGDVSGSVEAVEGALQGIGNNIAGVKIVSTGVGDVTESDVSLAKAMDGIVVAFSVNIPRPVESIAVEKGVPYLKSAIIYELMDLVKKRVIDLLPPVIERRVVGEADVLQIFDIHLKGKKTMKVAGCRVINGTVEKNKMARVIRDGETIYEGKLETLRHLKREIMEASKGLECGMAFAGWDNLQQGDLVQSYSETERPGSL